MAISFLYSENNAGETAVDNIMSPASSAVSNQPCF